MGLFNQTILDSLLDKIAVIDQNGIIIATNKSWVDFSLENGGDLFSCGIGNDFLSVCQEEVRSGIVQVLKGTKEIFTYEYPCHSETEARWFLLRATPFPLDQDGANGVVVSHVDITDRKLIELQLQRNEKRYRFIAENSTDFISIHDIDGVFTYASPICYSVLGYEPHELIGKSTYDYIHENDLNRIKSSHDIAQHTEDIQTVTYRFRCKEGKYIWFETRSQIVPSVNKKQDEIICFSRDVSKNKLKIKKLETEKRILKKTTYTDELTGLYNRRFFNKQLEEEYAKTIEENTDFSLLAIDIDQFKPYNDAYGHQQGDECLVQVAKSLKEHVRDTDFVCRTGGEEFAILLPNANQEKAITLAERLCKKVEELNIIHTDSDVSRFVTVSIGLSTETGSGSSHKNSEELFAAADKALYEAKESGRNQVKT